MYSRFYIIVTLHVTSSVYQLFGNDVVLKLLWTNGLHFNWLVSFVSKKDPENDVLWRRNM